MMRQTIATVPIGSPVADAAVSRFHLLTKPASGGVPTSAMLPSRKMPHVAGIILL